MKYLKKEDLQSQLASLQKIIATKKRGLVEQEKEIIRLSGMEDQILLNMATLSREK